MATTQNGSAANLAVRTETALAPSFEPRDLSEAWDLAGNLSKSALLPTALRGKPADVFVQILTGRELGLSAMQAIRSIDIIQGKPVAQAQLMVALAKRSPVCRYFRMVESTDESATYETLREGETTPTRITWTITQAKAAGLTGKDNWKGHPAAMLRARCSSALARAVYPDLVLGIYEQDEGDEIAREPSTSERTYTPPRDEPRKIREVPVTVTKPGEAGVGASDDTPPEEPAAEEPASDDAEIAKWTDAMRSATNQADLDAVARSMRTAGHAKGSTVGNAIAPVYRECKANLAAPEPGSEG